MNLGNFKFSSVKKNFKISRSSFLHIRYCLLSSSSFWSSSLTLCSNGIFPHSYFYKKFKKTRQIYKNRTICQLNLLLKKEITHLLRFLLLLDHANHQHWSDFWILFALKSESLRLHDAQNGNIHRLVQFVEFAHSSQQKYRPSWYVKLPLHVQQAIPLLHAHRDRFFLSAQQCFPYIQQKRHYKNEKR